MKHILVIKLESGEWYITGPHAESKYQEIVSYYKNATIEEVHNKKISKATLLHCLEWGGELS